LTVLAAILRSICGRSRPIWCGRIGQAGSLQHAFNWQM